MSAPHISDDQLLQLIRSRRIGDAFGVAKPINSLSTTDLHLKYVTLIQG